MKNFIVTTAPLLDEIKIDEYLGVVNINIVIGANFFSDFAASLTDFFGGNSNTYQNKMNSMYDTAVRQLKRKVISLGGNALIGLSIDFDELSGKGKSMFMLNAIGTACKVILDNNKQSEIVNNEIVASEDIERDIKITEITNNLSTSWTTLSESRWNDILSNPSIKYLPIILERFFPMYDDSNMTGRYSSEEKTSQLIYMLPEDEVKSLLYEYYPKKREVRELIIRNQFFDPEYILKLFEENFHLVIPLLQASKQYYTKDDLNLMYQILERFHNLPEIAQHSIGKTSLLGKEQRIIICPLGHKRSESDNIEFCPECGLNNYGLSEEDLVKIKEYEEKLKVISSYLSK